jgi:ribose transport system permease protein
MKAGLHSARRVVRLDRVFLIAPVSVAAAAAAFAALVPSFASASNLGNLAGQTCVLALLAVGQMCVMLVRGFDISVGAVAATCSAFAALAMNAWGPAGAAIALLAGAAFGAANGALVAYGRVPPIVATLGMLLIARAVGRLATDDGQVVVLADAAPLASLAYGSAFGLPVLVWVVAGLLACVSLWLARTPGGRRLYMAGSNPESAHLVGVSVPRATLQAYTACGVLAAAAGLVLLARSGAGMPAEGGGLELQSIAAAIIGGTALTGGVGSVIACALGALFIQTVVTGLNLAAISPFVAQVLLGLLIVCSGYLDALVRSLGGGSALSLRRNP